MTQLADIPKKFLVSKDKVTKDLVREFYDWVHFTKEQPDVSMRVLDDYLKPETTVLDLGCGCGMETLYFAQKGHRVVGVDISPEIIKVAKNRTSKYSNLVSFIVDDMTTVKLKEKFLLVLLHDCLEHVFEHEQKQTIENAISHLDERGILFVKCPTMEWKKKFCDTNILEGHYVNLECFQVLDEIVSMEMVKQVMEENGVELDLFTLKNYHERVPQVFVMIGRKER